MNNPRGFCQSMSVRSRMWDAWVVIDGGEFTAFMVRARDKQITVVYSLAMVRLESALFAGDLCVCGALVFDVGFVCALAGVSYPFNDGAVLDLGMYDEDALRCVYVDPRSLDSNMKQAS